MKLSESEFLMRKSQQKIMMHKVKEFIKEFTLIQQDYEQKIQERIIRQYNIVNPDENVQSNNNIDRHTQIFANEVLFYKISKINILIFKDIRCIITKHEYKYIYILVVII